MPVYWTSPYPRQLFDELAAPYAGFVEVWDRLDPRFGVWLAGQVPGSGGRALDLGCGPGRHVGLLAGRFARVLAVDPSWAMVDIASRAGCGGAAGPAAPDSAYDGIVEFDFAGITAGPHARDCRPGPGEVTPGEYGLFDLVLAVHALHHAGPARVMLARVRDLVAPGGRLVVADVVADPGEWADSDWQVQRASDAAERALRLGGTEQDAQVITGLLLHPDWLAMVATDTPLSPEQFHAAYAAAFPGATISVGEVGPMVGTCVWRRPGEPAAGPACRGAPAVSVARLPRRRPAN